MGCTAPVTKNMNPPLQEGQPINPLTSEQGEEGETPDAIAQHLKDSGIDGVITANNHILDRGYKGTLRTLDVLRSSGLDTLGANKRASRNSG